MSLFRKKKEESVEERYGDVIALADAHIERRREVVLEIVEAHLAAVHEPGGIEAEKKRNDFADLGMKRIYLDALDDLELTILDKVVHAPISLRIVAKGQAQVMTRWTVRGRQRGEIYGIPGNGQEVTITGMTYSSLLEDKVRTEFTYWELPELTRRMVER